MKDIVRIDDVLSIAQIMGEETIVKEVPVIRGYFSCLLRERGKIVPGSRREGENIWTLTGREYLAQLMSYATYSINAHNDVLLPLNQDAPMRDDRIRYIGFGSGTQAETASVSRLVTPISIEGATFLAQVGTPTFPLAPSKTTVRYTRIYAENELSFAGPVTIAEAGLFSDGNPDQAYLPRTRDTSMGPGGSIAILQAPAAYKSFEPIKKTVNFVLEVNWEIKF